MILQTIRDFLVENATLLSALGGVSGILGFIYMRILRPIFQALSGTPTKVHVRDVYGACKTYLTPGETLDLSNLRKKGYFNG